MTAAVLERPPTGAVRERPATAAVRERPATAAVRERPATRVVRERPATLFGDAPLAGGRPLTLEERLESTLRAAQAEGTTECPVCDARMTRDAAGARCGGCGSHLS